MTLNETIFELKLGIVRTQEVNILEEAAKWLEELKRLLDDESRVCPLCGLTKRD